MNKIKPKKTLLKKCSWIATMNPDGMIYNNYDLLIEGNMIKSIQKDCREKVDEIIEGSGKLVIPGLVNTHHHLFQSLTRCVPRVENAGLLEWVMNLCEIWRELTPEAIYTSTLLGLGELMLTGCTTTTDMLYMYPKNTDSSHFIDQQFKAAGDIGMRFMPCRGSLSCGVSDGAIPPDDIVQDEETILEDCERLIEKYHDPSPFAMTRMAIAPSSFFCTTPRFMKRSARSARKYGVRLHTHLAETSDEEEFCREKHGVRPFELMESIDWLGEDVWFAHCVHLNGREIRKMAETGTGMSHCPSSNMRLGSGIAPIPEMLNDGVNVSLGVDGAASNDTSDMIGEMRTGLLLHRVNTGPDSLDTREIIRMATTGGAKVLGFDSVGSLEPGKAADVVMINMNQLPYAGALHDPLAAIVLCGASHIVDTTIINGEVTVRQGKLTKICEEDIVKNANRIAGEMMERAIKRTGINFLEKPMLIA
ncbi:MAG: 8-oxoguanine deaminase [Candidatus Eremiobacteraeota bacterium]|nr:8-oxoguanine deaminase [Candidatus Eremiobacteraeota bacterium]